MEGFFSGFKPTWIIPFYHRNKRKIRKSKLHQPTAFLYYMMFKWFINDIYTSKNLKRQYYFSGHFQKTSTSSICKKLGEGKRVFFRSFYPCRHGWCQPSHATSIKGSKHKIRWSSPKKMTVLMGIRSPKQTNNLVGEMCIWLFGCCVYGWISMLAYIWVNEQLFELNQPEKPPGRIVSNYALKGKSVVCCSYIWIIHSLFTHVKRPVVKRHV